MSSGNYIKISYLKKNDNSYKKNLWNGPGYPQYSYIGDKDFYSQF